MKQKSTAGVGSDARTRAVEHVNGAMPVCVNEWTFAEGDVRESKDRFAKTGCGLKRPRPGLKDWLRCTLRAECRCCLVGAGTFRQQCGFVPLDADLSPAVVRDRLAEFVRCVAFCDAELLDGLLGDIWTLSCRSREVMRLNPLLLPSTLARAMRCTLRCRLATESSRCESVGFSYVAASVLCEDAIPCSATVLFDIATRMHCWSVTDDLRSC